MTWSGFFTAALNRVISDDSSNSSIVLGLHTFIAVSCKYGD